jgi:glycolate oxidase iron-sulfur subunit
VSPSPPPESQLGSPLAEAVYAKSLDCVHCGLCLTACPTYLATGSEVSSPRGRIYLLRGVAEGKIPLGPVVAEEAHLCLGCRACESACPSGVEFGAMIDQARWAVRRAGLRGGLAARIEGWLLRGVVVRPRRLRWLANLLSLVQQLGLDLLLLPLLPQRLREAHGLLPAIPDRRERAPLPAFTPAEGERRGRVAFFTGCVAAELLPEVNRATVRVLTRNGFEVVVPGEQTCCGALHAHTGDLETARELARRNAAVLGTAPVDAVVVNAAGCGAALREAPVWIGGEGEAMAARVRDVSEFLDEVGLRDAATDSEGESLRVCYDDPCHLVHAQGIAAAPRRLLEQIPGLELVDHHEPESCCGAAGIYNITHPAMSRTVLARKMDFLEAADPDIIATGNPGCLMQLREGARERGMRARVCHPLELLDEA